MPLTLFDHVAQQVAALHAVVDAGEDRRRSRRARSPLAALRARAGRRTARRPSCRPGATASSWLMNCEQVVAGDAVRSRAQSRQRYGGSMAGRNFLPRELGLLVSARVSRSSRNFRNMIQVSIGSRSRSPLSPLSLRMMSRADLSSCRAAGRWSAGGAVRGRLLRSRPCGPASFPGQAAYRYSWSSVDGVAAASRRRRTGRRSR